MAYFTIRPGIRYTCLFLIIVVCAGLICFLTQYKDKYELLRIGPLKISPFIIYISDINKQGVSMDAILNNEVMK